MLSAAICTVIAVAIWGKVAAAADCDSVCQGQQRNALQLFYSSLAGADWVDSTNWNTPDSSTPGSLPAHCSWSGVTCCLQGVAVVLFKFTPPLILECTSSLSVAGLHFVGNGLQGKLPDTAAAWQSLSSLLYLEVSGARLVALYVY